MKLITLITLLSFASAGLLQAQGLERLRRSSENIGVNTSGLKKNSANARTAASQYEIQPTPVEAPQVSTNPLQGLAKLIVTILKLLFSPNGDIEIASPVAAVPRVDGTLGDDQAEETYDASYSYKPVDPADYQDNGAQQPAQPQQPYQQPQQSVQPGSGDNSGDLPQDLKRKALDYFNANSDKIQNKRFVGIIDFAAHSSKARFFLLDMQSGSVRAIHVAHGKGSDPDGDGYATKFSNVPESKASSLGFYLTGALYNGSHGKSMRLHGLSPTNSNALARAVVIHESNYVQEANVTQGRSFGCPAVAVSEIRGVLAALNGGALIYAGLSNSEF